MSIRRIASVAAVVASLLALAGVTPATAVGGTSRLAHSSGSGYFGFGEGFDFNTFTNVFVEVQTGTTTFRPRTPGGPPITSPMGVVDISFDQGYEHAFGCWLIPNDMLVVNADLSATLSFDSSDPRVSECPGDPIGIGGGGLVFGLQGTVLLTMTFTPAGPITSTRTTSRLSCNGFMSLGVSTQQNLDESISGSASGTFSDNDTPFAAQFANGNGTFTAFQGSGQASASGSPGCGPF